MKRLLCIVSAMNTGGAETFLMKMYRAIDREQYQMDFLVNAEENYYGNEILALGGKIYHVPAKSKDIWGWYRGTKRIVRENGYRYVIRVCEHSLAAMDLLVAKWAGADHLIMRSSNAASGSLKSVFVHKMFRFLTQSVPTVKLAPSTEAAEYTFGKGCVARGEVVLLHNALDTDIFRFDPIGRERVRKEFDIDNRFVIGHVGRFNQQKNHSFLLDVFNEIVKQNPKAVLVLVGKGELEDAVRQKVKKLGLQDYVIFAGIRKDIPQVMSAFDVFAFPSFYEGMPNTVIEAQATGLPCIVSDTITQEANVTGLVHFLPLGNAGCWASCMEKFAGTTRIDTKGLFFVKQYDIASQVKAFTEYVFGK